MEFRVLGPLEVRAPGGVVDLGGPRQRAVLAALLLRANEVATIEYLACAVWESPPVTLASNLRTYVAGLRRRLGGAGDREGRLITRPGGYLLSVDAEEFDLARFDALVREADAAPTSRTAAENFAGALELWRGRPFEGLACGNAFTADLTRLEDRRLAVVEKHVRARLALGQHADLVPELRRLVTDHPLREELWAHLMTALHRSGQRADALAAYRELHRLLDAELGVLPGRSLRQLQALVLDDGAPEGTTIDERASAPVRQLPPDVDHFTGRQGQLAEILSVLTRPGRGTVPVVAVTGQPGAGKSALAVRAGHRLAEEFPGGQLFVDLLGAGTRPRDPGEVLARFLRDLGVWEVDIPLSTEERSTLFRDRVAGRRMLLVLDNAATEAQVRPLLPGSPGCGVLVTSRRRLTGLDVSLRVQLGELDLAEAVGLLAKLAGAGRTVPDAPATHRIVRSCGNLPLAIRIIGTKLRAIPHLTTVAVADRLEDECSRLDELVGGDREVRAGFLVSYAQLSAAEQRAFRLLALMPGTDFTGWAVAAVLDTDPRKAQRMLEGLVEANLVECASPERQRYRFHDLIRLLAEERALAETSVAEREAALDRVLNAYLFFAQHADAALDFGGLHHFELSAPPKEIMALEKEILQDPAAWFDEEQHCLLDAVEKSAAAGMSETVCRLTATLVAYLEQRARWDEMDHIAELSLIEARRSGNAYWAPYAVFARGLAARERHDILNAQALFTECFALLPAANAPVLEMVALLAVGVGHRFQGRYDAAADCFTRCFARLSTLDEPRWVAYTQRELAVLHRYRGDLDEADQLIEKALAEFERLGDRRWVALCLRERGILQRERGDFDSALRVLRKSCVLFHDYGDVRREAASWRSLAYVYRAQGEFVMAEACCERSAELFARTLDEHAAACTEVLCGEMLAQQGHVSQGLERVRGALAVFERLGDPRWLGKAELSLGVILDSAGMHDAAREAWARAHTTLTAIGAAEAAETRMLSRP